MSFLSKLFGRKDEAAQASAAPSSPPLGLTPEDPRGAAEKCLAAVAAMAEASEDPRERATLLARIADARLHGDDVAATLRALVATFNVGMQLGLVPWMVELCREFAHELPKGKPREALRPMIDALGRVLEIVDDPRMAQDLRIELGPLQALVGDHAGAVATVAGIADAYFADQARSRVVERLCENGDATGAEALAAQIQDPEAQAAARKALVHERAKRGVDAALEQYAAGIKLQPYRDDVRVDLALAKVQSGDLDGGLALARAIGKPETQAVALTQIAETLAEKGEFARAEEIVATIPEKHGRSSGWAALVSAHLQRGDASGAEALLERITEVWVGVDASVRVARSAAFAELPEDRARLLMRALTFLRGAQSANEAQAARRKAAEILANGGNAVEALRIADVGPKDERPEVLTAIGLGLALHGALDEVDRLQGSFKKADERAALLLGAAGALLRRK